MARRVVTALDSKSEMKMGPDGLDFNLSGKDDAGGGNGGYGEDGEIKMIILWVDPTAVVLSEILWVFIRLVGLIAR
jgi:hypothetical protein